MAGPTEHKPVQARILHYAQEIGWHFVSRAEARRGFDPDGAAPEDRALATSLYFGNMPHKLIPAPFRVHDLDFPELEAMQ